MNLIILASACNTEFFGFPTWWKYLQHPNCQPQINNINDVWLIAAAIVEIILRVAALIAVFFIIYGGFGYTTSQGDPEGTSKAKSTLVNALVGLAISVSAAVIVAFIAKSVQ